AGQFGELFGQEARHIVSAQDAEQMASRVHDRQPADALAAHMPDRVVHEFRCQGVLERAHDQVVRAQKLGIDATGHDLNDQIPIRHNADRPRTAVAVFDDDDVSDVTITHHPRELKRARVATAGHRQACADFADLHVRLLGSFSWQASTCPFRDRISGSRGSYRGASARTRRAYSKNEMIAINSATRIIVVTKWPTTKPLTVSTAHCKTKNRPRDSLHSSICAVNVDNSAGDGSAAPPSDEVLQRGSPRRAFSSDFLVAAEVARSEHTRS